MSAREYKTQMIAMRKAGKTYREIAEQFGISKQWVYMIIADTCSNYDKARMCDVDIESIVYVDIYDLFANDYKMTISKFARITFDTKGVTHAQKERIRRLIFNYGENRLSIRNIRNICQYIGKPFEEVFEVRT